MSVEDKEIDLGGRGGISEGIVGAGLGAGGCVGGGAGGFGDGKVDVDGGDGGGRLIME